MYSFTIEGKPVAKQRPRFSRRGDRVCTFDPQKNEARLIRTSIMSGMTAAGLLRVLSGCISVKMIFHTPIPSKCSQKRFKSLLSKPDKRRPDLDNYVKMYADVMNGLIYNDDSQITKLFCEKSYSDVPRVEITVTDLEVNSE